MQQPTCKMVSSFSFLFSFSLFYSLRTKPPNLKKKSWGKFSEKHRKKCEKVWKGAKTILPFSCCPFSFSLRTGPFPLQPHFVRGPPPPLPLMSSEVQKKGELAREVRGSKDKTQWA